MKKLAEKLKESCKAFYKEEESNESHSSPFYCLWYKAKETDKKWKKSSLSMKDREALSKDGEKLKKQEGWASVKTVEGDKDPNDMKEDTDIDCVCDQSGECECGTDDDQMYEDASMVRHINQQIGQVKDKLKPITDKVVKLAAKQKEETDTAKYNALEKQINDLHKSQEKYRVEIKKLVSQKKSARKRQ